MALLYFLSKNTNFTQNASIYDALLMRWFQEHDI